MMTRRRSFLTRVSLAARLAPPARRPIAIANWKMYLSSTESVRAAQALRTLVGRLGRRVEVVLCPAFPSLQAVRAALADSRIALGAQDVHAELSGPYTGDVSVTNLRGLTQYVIVGHSERRERYGETDDAVAQKVRRVLSSGLHPMICVGETAEERDDGETTVVVRRQVQNILQGVPALSLARCVFAYEPRWAISRGPGKPAPQPDPRDASEIIRFIRKVAADRAGQRYAERLRVVYGGSVESRTCRAFVCEPGVDGALVGGASTKPAEFAAIIQEILRCHS